MTEEQQKTLNALLHKAVIDNKFFLVTVLIYLGADIHNWDDDALCLASVYGHFDILKHLVEYGANIHALHDWAIENAKTKKIKEYLLSKIK